ncbi:hypothetical protein B0T10DRAFT_269355 [Thelonectria olida]|uniref:Uncharacterized protein n=1 Tax=Thelonectria olida TaxID=1576542 RepID=A0A9P8W9G6_9HYPO|nr:hypothetical protein B0T10DRAFT_269355 [Thelonectria olida]
MAYYDSKHNDTMEAGLLSTHEEEERMLLKEALYQDEDPETYMEPAPKNSTCKRILMALGICFLVGIAAVSIGSATGVCPGHMRHASPTQVSVKDAVHRHNPNLSHAMGYMAKRQNTPISSETRASETQQATEPTSNEQTTQAQETTSEAAATTQAAATTSAESETQATTAEPQSTEESDSSTDSGTFTTEEAPSETSSSPSESSSEASEASEPASTSSSRPAQSDQTTSEPTQATITEGTKTTSSAVAKTLTSTRSDGGVVTFTSTSWVAVVPSSKATTTSNPDLQNAAPQFSGHSALTAAIGMIFGGLLLL